MTSLKRAAVTGAFWSVLSTLVSRGLRFLTTIFLMRWLAPHDFGILAMAALVMDVAEMLGDLGLGAALIQRKELEPQHLSTCFWMNLALGTLLWAVTVAASPWVSHFYQNPEVQSVLAVLALNLVIAPLGSIPWVILNRELRFKQLMIAQAIATLARTGLSVVLAWNGAGVWSLVWGPLLGTATGSVVNWWSCTWRPSLQWSGPHLRDLLTFGRNVFGERLLGYFVGNSDYLVTGRVLGASALGFYNLAYQVPHLPNSHVAPIINRVLFPVLSSIQDDPERLCRAYLRCLRWIAAVAAPFAVMLAVTAPELVPLIYGARWSPAILPLQILCVAGLVTTLANSVWTLLQSIGRPEVGLRWNAVTLPIVVAAVIVGSRFDILGVAVAMSTAAMVKSIAVQHITNRLVGLAWTRWIAAVRGPLLAAAATGVLLVTGRLLLVSEGWPPSTILGLMIAVGALTYAGVLVGVDPSILAEVRDLLRLRAAAAPPIAVSEGGGDVLP